jgi:hypothetical protein
VIGGEWLAWAATYPTHQAKRPPEGGLCICDPILSAASTSAKVQARRNAMAPAMDRGRVRTAWPSLPL